MHQEALDIIMADDVIHCDCESLLEELLSDLDEGEIIMKRQNLFMEFKSFSSECQKQTQNNDLKNIQNLWSRFRSDSLHLPKRRCIPLRDLSSDDDDEASFERDTDFEEEEFTSDLIYENDETNGAHCTAVMREEQHLNSRLQTFSPPEKDRDNLQDILERVHSLSLLGYYGNG